MAARNFIQETIDTLSSSSKEIEKNWKKFQLGEINKEAFEERYKHVISSWVLDLDSEVHSPNNGCMYSETCPTSDYFKQEGI